MKKIIFALMIAPLICSAQLQSSPFKKCNQIAVVSDLSGKELFTSVCKTLLDNNVYIQKKDDDIFTITTGPSTDESWKLNAFIRIKDDTVFLSGSIYVDAWGRMDVYCTTTKGAVMTSSWNMLTNVAAPIKGQKLYNKVAIN